MNSRILAFGDKALTRVSQELMQKIESRYTVNCKLVKREEEFRSYLAAAGFSYKSAIQSRPGVLSLTGLRETQDPSSFAPSFDLSPTIKSQQWALKLPPEPQAYGSRKSWLRATKSLARDRGIEYASQKDLVREIFRALAANHFKLAPIPSYLAILHTDAYKQLNKLEDLVRELDAPQATPGVVAEVRLAYEHLSDRLWAISELAPEVQKKISLKDKSLTKLELATHRRAQSVLKPHQQMRIEQARAHGAIATEVGEENDLAYLRLLDWQA